MDGAKEGLSKSYNKECSIYKVTVCTRDGKNPNFFGPARG